MGKKLPNTPRSRIRSALRQVWLRSRERNAAIKRTKNTCEHCGVKGTTAKGKEVKIQVHHANLIDWDGIIDLIVQRILEQPYIVLCENCHEAMHKKVENGENNGTCTG